MTRFAVVNDVGVANEEESGRGAQGGVVVSDGVENALDTWVVVVREELVVDEVEIDEPEAVGADEDEASVTAPRKHEENVAPEADNP